MLKDMKTHTHLKPGQKGTKKLVTQYGDALVCVRYRYDAEKHNQFKTVEIIISESEWTPPPAKHSDSDLVSLRIGMTDKSLQDQVKAVGGRWDREKQFWFVKYGSISGGPLENHIHIDRSTNQSKAQNHLYVYGR